ncbi:hypothetical protein [Cryobacterium aureum]|uniref:hypothetical protein n=1 Tax=Cryobacterium aureum TaxID=995037 RepID=UPI000CF4916C|nr:hypothetical protein [Cryobacterium aureum]
MARIYATPTDYTGHAEEAFEGDTDKLTKRLRSASIEVDRLTRLAIFDTDAEGVPTDVKVIEAFVEATCAIVEYWGITDDVTGAESHAGAVKIGSVSLGTTSSASGDDSELDKLKRRIGEKCFTILENAGLRSSTIVHY